MKVAAEGLVLVIWRGSVEEAPSWTVPKSREMGESARAEGVASPSRLMKSSAVLESEVISMALMRVLVVPGCGVNVTMRRQLEEGRMVSQLVWVVKSVEVRRPVMWMGVVPVLANVMDCGCAALPTCVVAKVREFCEAV